MAKKVFIKQFDKKTENFYQILGPFFGNRLMAKEVGIQPFDDDEKKWFVSMIGNDAIGVASLHGIIVCDCWVFPEYRNQGVFSSLVDFLIRNSTGNLRANCTKMSYPIFAKFGFNEIKKTKNYTLMELCRA